MNLWIRSQDRMSLTMVSDLNINCDNEIIVDDGCSAGKYESKERALEVLDSIQKFLINSYSVELSKYERSDLIIKSKILENMVKIYNMPEKLRRKV